MIDFLLVATRRLKSGMVEIYPKFIMTNSKDLMIRGRDFYAIWLNHEGRWSTDEQDVIHLIDHLLDEYAIEHSEEFTYGHRIMHMWDAETGMIDIWHRYCQKQMRDSFKMLDENLVFANSTIKKSDYASKRLPYSLEEGNIDSYDRLMSVLYEPSERLKIEWAIGAVVSGDSKKIQKFMVLYGSAGTGKSTILNIIQMLFEGYYGVFDAKAIGSSNNAFALESFKGNPLVGLQHDGDLSKIEDNTRLNSLVSHEIMPVNEKFKATFQAKFKCFLFMGTNKPVKITDSKSGLIRRLIDVTPSGNKVSQREYMTLTKQVEFELGAIAYHCLQVYSTHMTEYDSYIPINMLGVTNDFYNFVLDSYFIFKEADSTTLKAAWELYKRYCDDANVLYPLPQRAFKEELKSYFNEYAERYRAVDDTRIRNYYLGFRVDQFDGSEETPVDEVVTPLTDWLAFKKQKSIFDTMAKDYPAQYATASGIPSKSWERNKQTLGDLDTTKLHYVQVPVQHIVIDFDIPGPDGKKSLAENIAAASTFLPTYGELSKSGQGIHLHYLYSGDVETLSRVYDDHIEVKIFTGNSALRRLHAKCNNLELSVINSGLPIKEEVKKMVNQETVKSEKGLRTLILRNLCKEIHGSTVSSIDFIFKILEDAHKSGLAFDVSDMHPAVLGFATRSSHKAEYCVKRVSQMKFKSKSENDPLSEVQLITAGYKDDDSDLVFFDTEVFPNLFMINWKMRGKGQKLNSLINPTPAQLEFFLKFKMVGFNCRGYDNHIVYARMMGYSNIELYKLSKRIIDSNRGSGSGTFREAYNLSYTDVYDFASAANKKSLKKWEIELGIHHSELGLPWDQPVPENLWASVSEYCNYDVLATEAVFDHLDGDWQARKVLAKLTGMSTNDSTNSLSTRFIFGMEKTPNGKFGTVFNWRNLAEPVHYSKYDEVCERYNIKSCRVFDETGAPTYSEYTPGTELPIGYSIMPFFPGYEFKLGKSTYRNTDVGEGGEVYAEQGMHGNVPVLDIESMHPRAILEEWLFGPYTKRFADIVGGRLAIKHEDIALLKTLLDGALAEFIDSGINLGDLSLALKTVINSVYGLTSAHFVNAFSDARNIDNIVAKRGALFMVNLRYAVQEQGFTVAHIKTDSIKIPDATPEIIKFVYDYGREFGYSFEHESTYDRMCLVNDAVYIAKYASQETCTRLYGYVPKENKKHEMTWAATGKQFAVPYVFKTLFSGEDIEFDDLCETFQVQSELYLDMDEILCGIPFDADPPKKVVYDPDKHDYHFIGKVGRFCPIKPGKGGGLLMRKADDKYHFASGSKGFRWLEADMVLDLHKEGDINLGYFDKMVEKAKGNLIMHATKEGGLEWFLSNSPYIMPEFINGVPIYPDQLPFL